MAVATDRIGNYTAYHQRTMPPEDAELTHVGPGTPCGEYFRRFWIPVALSRQLGDLPLRTRILGEDLVAFRDYSGNVGVLQLYCSHRGTSLEFGQIRERGLQCCYHGWLYDVDGTILDTPGEEPTSQIKHHVRHGAYPAHEHAGLVFAYMGPPETMPPFPLYDFWDYPEYPQVVYDWDEMPCNWLQIKENAMDPWHLYFLHTTITGPQFTPDLEQVPEQLFLESPLGMVYVDIRRMEADDVWVRMADFITPLVHQFPAGVRRLGGRFRRPAITRWAVPIDDRNTATIWANRYPPDQTVPASRDFLDIWAGKRPYEERQRKPGDFEARCSIYDGLAIHAREHLGTTDQGVIMLRNVVRRGVGAVRNGDDPQGVSREGHEVIPTYAHERFIRAPVGATRRVDKHVLREAGRKLAEEVFHDPLSLHRLAAAASPAPTNDPLP